MYSTSESGIDTDHEGRTEGLKLKAVIPNKAQYNAKEKLVLIFNSNLSDKGSYHVEFKGCKRSKMDVKAVKMNNCTLMVEAPIYHPVEQVKIHVRHRTYEGSKIIGTVPFKFLSREEILADILRDYTGDPVTFMCESLGISPSDITALDEALAVTLKRNMPKGFNLLGLHNDNIGKEPADSLHPTLLHFAAAFGLSRLTRDCLLQCPGVSEASKMKNCRGMNPNEIAAEGGYEELAEEILTFQAQQEEGIYESMEEKDAEYLQMGPGYINVQLWSQPAYIELEKELLQSQEARYIDMNKNTESDVETDEHGYIDANRPDVQGSDELYMDMTKSSVEDDSDAHYVDVKGEHEGEDEDFYENQYRQAGSEDLYEPMVGDTGLGGDEQDEGPNATYDKPSNLSISQYPDTRSASMSMGSGGRRLKKLPKELPQESDIPPVPRRQTGADATSPRERLPSTGSRISDISGTSTASGASTSTTGSGHDVGSRSIITEPNKSMYTIPTAPEKDGGCTQSSPKTGDAEDDQEDAFMSREQLIKQLENSQKKERPPTRPPISPKHQRSSYAGGGALPPVPPPADYEQQSPPPVPSRGHCPRSPRAPRNHERSKTAPVNPVDVELAQKPNRNSSRSAKESTGTRQGQGTRPSLSKHRSSDLTSYSRAQESFIEQRRNSSEASLSRPPAPAPDRPPAPIPKEPAIQDPRTRGGCPTPMVLAMQREEPPPAPKRQPQGGPPKTQPRPAPRKNR